MSDSTERNCNKCIHHTSGMCDSWDCEMQTVEDVKKEAVNEYVKSVVEELEELKTIKSDGFTDDLLNMGFTKGYNKALDDFVKFASDMPTVEEEDGEIRPMWLEEMAEQLKAGVENERSI